MKHPNKLPKEGFEYSQEAQKDLCKRAQTAQRQLEKLMRKIPGLHQRIRRLLTHLD